MSNELSMLLENAQARVAKGWVQHVNEIDGRVCAGAAMVIAWKEIRGISLLQPHFVADQLYNRMIMVMLAAINELFTDHHWTEIPAWNDSMVRTQQEVLDTFERAMKIAERDG
jgi:hypothetical protein